MKKVAHLFYSLKPPFLEKVKKVMEEFMCKSNTRML